MSKPLKYFPFALVALYGAVCFSAYWYGGSTGFQAYAGLSVVVFVVLFVQHIGQMIIGAIVSGIVAGLHVALAASIVFAPLAAVGAVIVVLLFIAKFVKFAMTLPFMVACMLTCIYIQYVPTAIRSSFVGADPSAIALYGWGAGAVLLGVGLMLLSIMIGQGIVSAFEPSLKPSFGRATLLTIGWGWFALLFLTTLFTPHDSNRHHDPF